MPAQGSPARRRTRLARGPITIGEPAPAIEARLASSDPYRPDAIADGGMTCGLTVRAASVRGLSKRYAGTPRQDDLCLRVCEPRNALIAAVADGVSGASRSDMGAALAVRHATAAVARQLEAGSERIDWAVVFQQAAWGLVEEQRRQSGDPTAGVEQAGALATTLLVAVVHAGPEGDEGALRVELAAVGDSPALVLDGDCFSAAVGEDGSGDGLIGHAVTALPRGASEVSGADCTLAAGSVLLLCTDGLALPLGDGRGEVGRALARELATPPDVLDFARLLDFSRSTYDDDRTLVAVWAPRGTP